MHIKQMKVREKMSNEKSEKQQKQGQFKYEFTTINIKRKKDAGQQRSEQKK